MKILFILCFFLLNAFGLDGWSKKNLYDETTLSYYIPFELWLQTPWDGTKKRQFPKTTSNEISGPFQWYHPYLKKHIQVYKKTFDTKSELYTLYTKGIVKLYSQKSNSFFNNGIIFPAGFGWKLNKIYNFSQEHWKRGKHSIELIGIEIKEIAFENNVLSYISYNYYINGKLIKSFTFKPKK